MSEFPRSTLPEIIKGKKEETEAENLHPGDLFSLLKSPYVYQFITPTDWQLVGVLNGEEFHIFTDEELQDKLKQYPRQVKPAAGNGWNPEVVVHNRGSKEQIEELQTIVLNQPWVTETATGPIDAKYLRKYFAGEIARVTQTEA